MAFLTLFICIIVLVIIIGWYFGRFYPKQLIDPNDIQEVDIDTPQPEKYHNDCLHPCVRKAPDGSLWMVQSPWYMYDDSIENPILYHSNDPLSWHNGVVVEDTPTKGYNSDPNLFIDDDGTIYVFWREVGTEFCEQLGVICATVGVHSKDGVNFSEKIVYLQNDPNSRIDCEMCPILIKHNGKYLFYASWYNTDRENRKNLGLTIWEGTDLLIPNFELKALVPIRKPLVCDKYKQLWFKNNLLFIPKPHRFDLWHFDLFEKNGTLYLVACEEMKDNILMAYSKDWLNFTFYSKPLVNAHFMESFCRYRQQYYKPSVYINEYNNAILYYTHNDKEDFCRNGLVSAVIKC